MWPARCFSRSFSTSTRRSSCCWAAGCWPRRGAGPCRVCRLHGLASLWWLKVICGTRVEVRGRDKLPDGACLVAAKHQSAWDTFALIPVFRDPAMVMKAELGLIPLYGWFSHKFQHIFVKRDKGPSALRTMIRDARQRAAQGREVVIFPEGTRRPPGAAARLQAGLPGPVRGAGAALRAAGAQFRACSGRAAACCAIRAPSSSRSSIRSRPGCPAPRPASSSSPASRPPASA